MGSNGNMKKNGTFVHTLHFHCGDVERAHKTIKPWKVGWKQW